MNNELIKLLNNIDLETLSSKSLRDLEEALQHILDKSIDFYDIKEFEILKNDILENIQLLQYKSENTELLNKILSLIKGTL